MRSKGRANLAAAGLLVAMAAAQQVSPAVVQEMEAYVNCPREGRLRSGKTPVGDLVRLTLQKSRFQDPTKIDRSVTLAAMLKPGEDELRWNGAKNTGVEITGYVTWVIPNFLGEECNCYRTDDPHTDTHINITEKASDFNVFSKHVIVEVTPRMKFLAKKRGLDWSTSGLKKQFLGKKVKVRGWLLYDDGHRVQAQNTHPDDPDHKNWRGTCWEVHPITSIELNRG